MAARYRRALLAHRDGAALLTGTYPAEPHTLRFAEHLIGALLDAGADDREAAWTAWTVVCFALGLTQEEQTAPHPDDDRLTGAVYTAVYPRLARTLAHLRPDTFPERFDFGLAALLSRLP